MKPFIIPVQVRWSDLDPNVHLRHSVYYDWGSYCRIVYLEQAGLSTAEMQRLHVGPILFREECVFKKEVRLGHEVSISLEMLSARRDFTRWSIRHTITRNDEVAAILTVEGSWLDVVKRKIAVVPAEVATVFNAMPTASEFSWLD